MKRLLSVIGLMTLLVLVAPIPSTAQPDPPTISVTLLPQTEPLPPPKEPLKLAVGELRTFEIQVTSDEPFVLAIALTNQYYPGRGIYWHGSDRATHATEAVLHLTMKGKKSTADLFPVSDWPEPPVEWPEEGGVAPVAIAVGVRYPGGAVYSEQFPFSVVVP
jgi:hypothetical protein